jgi:hypothetical protein
MNYWLAQLLLLCEVALRYVARVSALGGQVLAARNSDERDTGWMQILVFVILTVFYAVGSIVKARANKAAPRGKEQIPHKPARKSPESTIDLQLLKQLWRPERPTPSSQPRPQVTKPQVQPTSRKVARPQPTGMAMLEPQVAKPQVAGPQVQPKVEVAAPAEKQPATYLSEILSDYEDPEKLRRAILYYEILGKPLSLREQERAF